MKNVIVIEGNEKYVRAKFNELTEDGKVGHSPEFFKKGRATTTVGGKKYIIEFKIDNRVGIKKCSSRQFCF